MHTLLQIMSRGLHGKRMLMASIAGRRKVKMGVGKRKGKMARSLKMASCQVMMRNRQEAREW